MEKLQIGEIIQKLRRENKITQEQLANHIGISTAAVSKWESGASYPDIVTLPILARFFNISIDELMNYKSKLTEDDVLNIGIECESIINEGKLEEGLLLGEKYLNQYPNSNLLKLKISDIYLATFFINNNEDVRKRSNRRSIKIIEEVLKNPDNIEMEEIALIQLSTKYALDEKPDKAEEVLKKIHRPKCNPDAILPAIYLQQDKLEEARKLLQNNLLKACFEIKNACMMLANSYYNYKEDMKIEDVDTSKAQEYLKLLEEIGNSFGNDGSKFINSMGVDFELAHTYIKNNERENSIRHLEKMLDYITENNIDENLNASNIWCFDLIEDNHEVYSSSLLINMYEELSKAIEIGFSQLEGDERYKIILKRLNDLSVKKHESVLN